MSKGHPSRSPKNRKVVVMNYLAGGLSSDKIGEGINATPRKMDPGEESDGQLAKTKRGERGGMKAKSY